MPSTTTTNPVDYMSMSKKELARRHSDLSAELRNRVNATGWNKEIGQLSRERNMIDAIGQFRFEDWYLTKNKKAK